MTPASCGDETQCKRTMPACRFTLNIRAGEFQAYYSAQAKSIIVRSDAGLKIAFPASELQKFVSHDGVNGRFEISFDADYKLISLVRL